MNGQSPGGKQRRKDVKESGYKRSRTGLLDGEKINVRTVWTDRQRRGRRGERTGRELKEEEG